MCNSEIRQRNFATSEQLVSSFLSVTPFVTDQTTTHTCITINNVANQGNSTHMYHYVTNSDNTTRRCHYLSLTKTTKVREQAGI